jgi:hypothetical protein
MEAPRLTNHINGANVAPAQGLYIDNVNPANNSVISLIPDSSVDDVNVAVAAAKVGATLCRVCACLGDTVHVFCFPYAFLVNMVAVDMEISVCYIALVELLCLFNGFPYDGYFLCRMPSLILNGIILW